MGLEMYVLPQKTYLKASRSYSPLTVTVRSLLPTAFLQMRRSASAEDFTWAREPLRLEIAITNCLLRDDALTFTERLELRNHVACTHYRD